ncbi:putative O-glycosylation ligase, exosortase A system-associated [Undibacterium sp. SXout20W]|uniref:putative O-glycosylation ligase, exosortase A system-associated n=1 Tax=Undibacterium sp. SXout20W TaxID=3413051 RepID=UPI003BF27542
MRDIILFCFIFAALPFAVKRPFIGVILFTWVSLMNPHRLTYGAAYSFPFEAMIVGVTVIGIFFSKEKMRFQATACVIALITLCLWMSVTTLFAMEPERAWNEWSRVMKTMCLFGVILFCTNTKKQIQQFAGIIALSIGFFGVKGGIFTILTAGNSHVYGPEGSYISDNNALALALLMALPIMWYLWLESKRKWVKIGFLLMVGLSSIAVVGSYSRGAILGGTAIILFLLLKSKHRIRTGLILLLIVPICMSIMPNQWFERMHSIDNYSADSSALGRLNAWQYAVNVANSSVTGGGFDCFTPRLFLVFAPEPRNHHAAHSIYFQVLGEHGYIGFILFLLFIFLAWRSGSRIIAFCKNRPDEEWASNLAAMCQVSMIGFAVGGAFLTMAYYDLFYDVVALLVLLEKFLLHPKKMTTTTDSPIQPELQEG